MNKKITIKLLTECPEHILELAALEYNEINQHWFPCIGIDQVVENITKHLNTEKMPLTFVAFLDEIVVGMASLCETDGIRPDLLPWLVSLVVHPDYRKQKIGEMLINAVKEQATHFGYHHLYLFALDHSIPRWYTKLNWKEIGADQYFGHSVTVMMLDL